MFEAQAIDQSRKAAPANSANPEWTVAVYLGVITDADGANGRMGSEDKARRLELLKEQTKQSSVVIVADVLDHTGVDPLKATQPNSGSEKPGYEVTRLLIHDGKEEVISKRPSKTTGANIASLMDYARKEQPSNKIAVVVSAHGSGDQGVNGGGVDAQSDGSVNPVELSAALKSGGADKKIDFLDLDGCFGAQLGAVKEAATVAKQLTASETWERAYSIADGRADDGQNLNSWLSTLIANPSMDGKQLAHEVIVQADKKANATISDATPTLAQFDLQGGLDHFNELLNNAGNALTTSMKTARNKSAIESVIDSQVNVTSLDKTDPMTGSMSKYDLDVFLKAIEQKIETGKLRDPGGHLKRNLAALEQEIRSGAATGSVTGNGKGLMPSFHFAGLRPANVDTPVQLAPLHGLSVYLPDAAARTGKVPENELRYVYNLEGNPGNDGWTGFLQSLAPIER